MIIVPGPSVRSHSFFSLTMASIPLLLLVGASISGTEPVHHLLKAALFIPRAAFKAHQESLPATTRRKHRHPQALALERFTTKGATPAELDLIIRNAARESGLDAALIKAVINAESQFNHREVSPAGACGLMQLMPGTAKLLSVENIFDPEQNVRAGTKHLRGLMRRFRNNLTLSLAAYNAGEFPVLKYKGVPPYPETQHYVKKVLRLYKAYQSSAV